MTHHQHDADQQREDDTVTALRRITFDLTELVELRGRITHAKTILAHNSDTAIRDALTILNGGHLTDPCDPR